MQWPANKGNYMLGKPKDHLKRLKPKLFADILQARSDGICRHQGRTASTAVTIQAEGRNHLGGMQGECS